MSRYELTEQSRQALVGEYLPAATQQQPIINVHVHNHTVSAGSSVGVFGIAGGIVKWSLIGSAAFVGVMWLQGHAPAESVDIAKGKATEIAPHQMGIAEGWYYQAKAFVLGGDVITIASRFVGMTEDADRSELSAYIKTGGLSVNPDNTAWCAAFVGAVLAEAGMKGTGELNAKSYLQWGVKTETPKRGDVVVLWRGSRESWKGHVGFFNGFDTDGNILILGGNQDDKVSVESFHPSRLLAYRAAP